MCEVNPEHKKNKTVLYARILRALFGMMECALHWYELFTETLQDLDFMLNPYDMCVANKTVNGAQCTIVWYVDDNKISHRDETVINEVVEVIEKKFGMLARTYGNSHAF